METLQPKLRFPEFKGNWERKTLKNICTINPSNKKLPSEFIYIDLDSVKDGVLTKENIVALEDAPSRAQRLLALDDVLFQMVRPYQKNNLYFGREGNHVASTGYAQLRANENPKFLFQYLHYQNFVDKVIERCTGSNYPAINSSDLANIELKITSLPEQTRIANFLSAVDEKLQLLKEKKALLEEYKKGMMQKIFNQELRFKDNNGEDFGDWENVNLEFISLNYYQGINTAADRTIYHSEGYPILQAKHITSEKISYEESKFVNQEDYDLYKLKYKPNIGEILISNIGTIGKVLLINENVDFLIAWNIFKVTLKPEITYPLYVTYNLKYVSGLGYFDECKTGNATKFVNKLDMLKTPILLPTYAEQTKIAQFLLAIDDKIGLVGNQIEETVEYKKGLLQGMFV